MAQFPPLTLNVTVRAVAHLQSISSYIRERNPSAAERVGDTIRASFEMLRRHPYAGRPGGSHGIPEKSVSKYPYVIVYEVVGDKPDTLVILGVYHTAQNERKI